VITTPVSHVDHWITIHRWGMPTATTNNLFWHGFGVVNNGSGFLDKPNACLAPHA
jgi:hypothetical protein